MSGREEIVALSRRIADAIGRRDVGTLERLLAPGFVHRTAAGEATSAVGFLQGIAAIPGEIVFVRIESVVVDATETGALATGIQHARVRLEGQEIDDRRGFVDWFVRSDGGWKLRAAIDLPAPPPE